MPEADSFTSSILIISGGEKRSYGLWIKVILGYFLAFFDRHCAKRQEDAGPESRG